MSTLTHSGSSNDHLDEVLNVINQLAKKSAGGDYIYRGEPEHYEKVSSSLYRQYQEIDAIGFDIEVVQKEMLKEASRYTSQTNKPEILAELQHYGGKTNLIDCTTDYLIALFFACNGVPDENGRVVLLRRSDDENKRVWQPRNPNNRVIAQKSVFVQPKKGFVEPAEEIDVPRNLKEPILNHLRKFHGISTETIYNDLHGFIKNQSIHQIAYAEFFWAITYQNQGNNEKAIEHYNEVIRLKPDSDEAYNNRGLAYVAKGDHARAIQDYDKAIALNPDLAEAYNNRGLAYVAKGDYARAIQDYDKAIALNPDDAIAYYNRGVAYWAKRDHDRAIQDYDRAIALNPDDAAAYNNRGNAYVAKGDYDRAIQDYDKAIALKPDDANAYYNRGVVYGAKGDHDRAIQAYTKAIDLNPAYADAYYNRGEAWLFLKEWDKARSDLTMAKNMGLDIAKLFSSTYGSVSNFEQKYRIQLPDDIAEMLTP